MKNRKVLIQYVSLTDHEKAIIADDAKRVFNIKDYAGNGIIIDTDSCIEKIEKALTDILYNEGKNTNILQDGNGKIDKSVLCQAIFPVISCPMHCRGCYAVNACTKKFNGIGKQTAESWYKWYFLSKYYRDAYYTQIDRELTKSKSTECRWHVSGDFIDNTDIEYCINTFKKHSDVKFYTYTKRDAERDNMPALKTLLNMENVNIVDSLPGGMKNYGDTEYLEKLIKIVKEKHNADVIICNCGTAIEKEYNKSHDKKNGGDGKKYCGGSCKACRDCKYIAFHEHK